MFNLTPVVKSKRYVDKKTLDQEKKRKKKALKRKRLQCVQI